ncbi:MAG: FixH family protein [Pseudomonadota bacterium]
MSNTHLDRSARPITGRMVLAIALLAFGVILTANLTLLFSATGSFPGLIVKNSYVASQGWDARTAAQRTLGWQSVVAHRDDVLTVRFSDAEGAPLEGLAPALTVGRPATDAQDRALTARAGSKPGEYEVEASLAPGQWRIAIAANDGKASYTASANLFVPEPK